jgi:hypothetical protein
MKIKTIHFFVFLIYLFSINFSYCQLNLLNKKVSIEFKDKKIPDAINLLNKKLGNIFSYKNDILPSKKIISINAKDETVQNVLEKILKDTDIRFFQIGDQIILKRSKQENDKEKLKKNKSIEPLNNIFLNEYTELSYLSPVLKAPNIAMTGKLSNSTIQYTLSETPECPFCDPVLREPDFSEASPKKRKGKHSLVISPGVKSNSRTSIVSNNTSVSTNSGVTTMMTYGYMFSETWQWNIQVGVFVADASVSDTVVSAKAIIPILFGIRHYPDFLTISDFGNIYVGGSIGTYIGFGSVISTTTGNISQAETKFGISVNLGMDLYPFRWLKIGPNVSFHLFGNYSKIIQESTNFSGTEVSFNMGIVF